MKLAHLINPVNVGPTSDLFVAQPITFAAMRSAQAFAKSSVEVQLAAACFPEDVHVAPEGFRLTPPLERSIQDLGTFTMKRKLPLLTDLLDRLYADSADADYLIYTNVDIAPVPSFYVAVAQIIEQGYDAFVINRRTLPKGNYTPVHLTWLYAQAGESHPGFDCFVFPRNMYPNYVLANTCIGLPPVGRCLALNLALNAVRFHVFLDLHLTFHIGDDRIWKQTQNVDARAYNWQQFAAICQHYAMSDRGAISPEVREIVHWPAPKRGQSRRQRLYRLVRHVGSWLRNSHP